MNIKIGSRKSELAISQTESVINVLKNKFPNDAFEIVGISTEGDKILDKSLKSFGGKGVFIKEIEHALLSGKIDMAVHSAKDLPTDIPEGLSLSAALLRCDRSDVLVLSVDTKINDIKIIGTGSERRRAQAVKFFPNAKFKPIRGNINTRISKLKNGEYDAVIMAKAAIERLNISDINVMPLDFVCAAGQGILAVETVKGNMTKYTDAINDLKVMTELQAERAFLHFTGGGCHAPCGASAVYNGNEITMRTFYAEGKNHVYLEMTDTDPHILGKTMAMKTLEKVKENI